VKDGTIKSLTQIAILSLLMDNDNYVARLAEILPLNSQTLYSAMKAMESKKLVSSYWQEGDIGGRRHMYSVTGAGREYYERNKVEIDYKLLTMEHKTEKTVKQDDKKIYIPIDLSENDPKADNKNAVNLPLTKGGKTETKAEIKPAPKPAPKPVPMPPPPAPPPPPLPPAPPPKINNKLGGYISPFDPIIATKKPQQMEIKLRGTLTVDLQPLLRPNSVKENCGFVLFNRLRFFAGVVTALLIAVLYIVMSVKDNTPTIYTIAFEALAVYFVFTLVIWLVLPNNKKKLGIGKLFGTRFAISFAAIMVVWAVYLLFNTANNVWGLVPTIFCAIPVIEGIIIIAFHKTRGFIC
jgi:DNA-binding PadR family transcriptional regulator